MKKFINFILFGLCIIGALGGVIVSLVYGRYETFLGIIGLSYTAWPQFKQYWYSLNFD